MRKHSPIPEYYRTFETLLVAVAAPTLAGLKSASIFSVGAGAGDQTEEKVRKWDEALSLFGVRLTVLKHGSGKAPAIVYVYRPAMVEKDLSDECSKKILSQCGYQGESLEELIEELSSRLSSADAFPHEIGLFIGYPPEDVEGFMIHGGRNFTCCGLWKAYGCKEEREKYFQKCEKCTRIYTRLFKQGRSVEQLTAAV